MTAQENVRQRTHVPTIIKADECPYLKLMREIKMTPQNWAKRASGYTSTRTPTGRKAMDYSEESVPGVKSMKVTT